MAAEEALCWETLNRLGKEYRSIQDEEEELTEILHRLKQEERCLEGALQEASQTGQEQLQRQRRDRQADIVARLEDALLGEDDSSSSNNNNNNSDDEGEDQEERRADVSVYSIPDQSTVSLTSNTMH